MYVIDINTHVLLFLNYYIVVPFTQFWNTNRSKKLVDCRFIWHSVFIFSSEKHNISKGKWDILEILILLFDFSILMLKFCNTTLHTQISLHLLILSIFLLQISHNFRNQEQTDFDLLFRCLFLCWFFLKRQDWI